MEERKQRIMRKYQSELMKVDQSDLQAPGELVENEQVLESEQFGKLEVGFDRQEAGTMLPARPPQARPVPQKKNSNWLLEDADLEDDPYATQAEEKGDDYWALWGGRAVDEKEKRSARRESAYDPYSDRENSYDSREQGISGKRTGIFGQQQTTGATGMDFGEQRTRTYGSSPENGLLQTSRFQEETTEERSRESQRYTPYKNPYVTEKNQSQQQQWGSREAPRTEYKQQDSFQQWKDRNKTWDPTTDDAYLDELMQKNRR